MYTTCMGILLIMGCHRGSKTRAMINDPGNGYIASITNEAYELVVQYQPPSYRADQEIMLHHSSVSRNELVREYDALQQFVLKYKWTNPAMNREYSDLTGKFILQTTEDILCIDAHQLTYSPGAPNQEIILLFPVTAQQLGKKFSLLVNDFPLKDAHHRIAFELKK